MLSEVEADDSPGSPPELLVPEVEAADSPGSPPELLAPEVEADESPGSPRSRHMLTQQALPLRLTSVDKSHSSPYFALSWREDIPP